MAHSHFVIETKKVGNPEHGSRIEESVLADLSCGPTAFTPLFKTPIVEQTSVSKSSFFNKLSSLKGFTFLSREFPDVSGEKRCMIVFDTSVRPYGRDPGSTPTSSHFALPTPTSDQVPLPSFTSSSTQVLLLSHSEFLCLVDRAGKTVLESRIPVSISTPIHPFSPMSVFSLYDPSFSTQPIFSFLRQTINFPLYDLLYKATPATDTETPLVPHGVPKNHSVLWNSYLARASVAMVLQSLCADQFKSTSWQLRGDLTRFLMECIAGCNHEMVRDMDSRSAWLSHPWRTLSTLPPASSSTSIAINEAGEHWNRRSQSCLSAFAVSCHVMLRSSARNFPFMIKFRTFIARSAPAQAILTDPKKTLKTCFDFNSREAQAISQENRNPFQILSIMLASMRIFKDMGQLMYYDLDPQNFSLHKGRPRSNKVSVFSGGCIFLHHDRLMKDLMASKQMGSIYQINQLIKLSAVKASDLAIILVPETEACELRYQLRLTTQWSRAPHLVIEIPHDSSPQSPRIDSVVIIPRNEVAITKAAMFLWCKLDHDFLAPGHPLVKSENSRYPRLEMAPLRWFVAPLITAFLCHHKRSSIGLARLIIGSMPNLWFLIQRLVPGLDFLETQPNPDHRPAIDATARVSHSANFLAREKRKGATWETWTDQQQRDLEWLLKNEKSLVYQTPDQTLFKADDVKGPVDLSPTDDFRQWHTAAMEMANKVDFLLTKELPVNIKAALIILVIFSESTLFIDPPLLTGEKELGILTKSWPDGSAIKNTSLREFKAHGLSVKARDLVDQFTLATKESRYSTSFVAMLSAFKLVPYVCRSPLADLSSSSRPFDRPHLETFAPLSREVELDLKSESHSFVSIVSDQGPGEREEERDSVVTERDASLAWNIAIRLEHITTFSRSCPQPAFQLVSNKLELAKQDHVLHSLFSAPLAPRSSHRDSPFPLSIPFSLPVSRSYHNGLVEENFLEFLFSKSLASSELDFSGVDMSIFESVSAFIRSGELAPHDRSSHKREREHSPPSRGPTRSRSSYHFHGNHNGSSRHPPELEPTGPVQKFRRPTVNQRVKDEVSDHKNHNHRDHPPRLQSVAIKVKPEDRNVETKVKLEDRNTESKVKTEKVNTETPSIDIKVKIEETDELPQLQSPIYQDDQEEQNTEPINKTDLFVNGRFEPSQI